MLTHITLAQDNYSFCGAFNPLSKLIICAVMLRGRHRGLPVAIDRAVMLPMEFHPDFQRSNIDGQEDRFDYQPASPNGNARSDAVSEKSPRSYRRNTPMSAGQEHARGGTLSPREANPQIARLQDEEAL